MAAIIFETALCFAEIQFSLQGFGKKQNAWLVVWYGTYLHVTVVRSVLQYRIAVVIACRSIAPLLDVVIAC